MALVGCTRRCFCSSSFVTNSSILDSPAGTGGPHVVILIHELDCFEDVSYLLREISAFWRYKGIRVSVQRGTKEKIAGDVAFLHVDLTVIPDDYRELVARFPKVINGDVLDISKKNISRNEVRRDENYLNPVIVKTNLNCGGWAEAKLVRRRGGLRKLAYKIRKMLPWSLRADFTDYRIFSSASDVPRAVWMNRDLIVERFLPERDGDLYCLRTWTFFGDREINSISHSEHPVVKGRRVLRRKSVEEIPDELRAMRKTLGFEFGKFDYGIVDGNVILYDVNRTPNIGDVSEQLREHVEMLSEGICSYLPKHSLSDLK